MSLDVRPDPEHPFGGYALLLLDPADVPGAEARISVFDNYSERYLAPGGWQSAPVTFGPFPVTRAGDRARIAIGPDIVNQIEENAPLRIGIDGAEFDIDWPIDVHPEAAEARAARLTGMDPAGPDDGKVETRPPEPVKTIDPVTVAEEPGKKPVALIAAGLATLLAAAAVGWFLNRPAPVPDPAPVVVAPPPVPEPVLACDAGALGALAGQPFNEVTARLASCGGAADQDAALGLIEDAAAANDPDALLLFGKLYDGAAEVPGIETGLGLTFEDAPVTAAEYYSRARTAGAAEAPALIDALCGRLREKTDTLSQGAVADHCNP